MFRFHIGILSQHWLVEQGRRPMTDWPATVAPKSERRRLCRLEARRVGGRPSLSPQLSSGNPDVVRLLASSRSTGRKQVGSHERFSEAGSRAHAQTGDG